MRILVTGSDGYIGAVLVPYLSDHGHDVIGLDTGYYAGGRLYNDGRDRPRTLVRDIRAVVATLPAARSTDAVPLPSVIVA